MILVPTKNQIITIKTSLTRSNNSIEIKNRDLVNNIPNLENRHKMQLMIKMNAFLALWSLLMIFTMQFIKNKVDISPEQNNY